MNLKKARGLVGVSQGRLAEIAGLDAGAISDIECGRNKRPAHDVVVKIVRALQRAGLAGITADDIFPVPDHQSSQEVA